MNELTVCRSFSPSFFYIFGNVAKSNSENLLNITAGEVKHHIIYVPNISKNHFTRKIKGDAD